MLTLLHLLSAVALLVWGTHIVRTGVMRVFGARLRTVLSRSVEKKPLAFCAGIGVTALVQSSNATTMLVTSFVAQDLVALAPALVIVLGADVGTLQNGPHQSMRLYIGLSGGRSDSLR